MDFKSWKIKQLQVSHVLRMQIPLGLFILMNFIYVNCIFPQEYIRGQGGDDEDCDEKQDLIDRAIELRDKKKKEVIPDSKLQCLMAKAYSTNALLPTWFVCATDGKDRREGILNVRPQLSSPCLWRSNAQRAPIQWATISWGPAPLRWRTPLWSAPTIRWSAPTSVWWRVPF